MHSMEDPSGMTDTPSRAASPGQLLRTAREAKGLHLAVLSVALKVPTRQLEALENDQYDMFKGTAFLRALAQAMCRHLGLDPAPVLAGLPKASSPLSQASPRLVEPVVSGSTVSWGRSMSRGKGVSRQVWMLAALMLVGSVALIWWPGTASEASAPAEVVQDGAPAPVPMEQASEAVEMVAQPASADMHQASANPSAASLAAVKPLVSTSMPVAAASQDKAVAEDAPLVMRASADAWVSVRDSRGEIVFKRQVKAGESVKLDISAPLFVYAGRADGMELLWRGKLVDLKPFTQNNEVRLPIKP